MNSAKEIKETYSESWKELSQTERMSSAGDLSVYFLEMLASAAAMKGDAATARNLLRASIQLEVMVKRACKHPQLKWNDFGNHKIH